ncbi:MAG: hypothetical protein LBP80_01700 [Treponema sp.]|nr:hypothetical protein [Treponema sp.]
MLLIVKIFLNSQKFSRKTNHNEPSVRDAEGTQRRHETTLYSFLLCLCGSKFFNVLANSSLWKVSAGCSERDGIFRPAENGIDRPVRLFNEPRARDSAEKRRPCCFSSSGFCGAKPAAQ